ncbi:TetR/AcrR family transcriptional regulator [Mycobacterium sp. MYCO198283]|uniref:TetR/AcrR family transcriptional regulator n=1 Tax=Mycobacterium sp. MYCO198283 TaxID=2883505 RepID=UPI0035AB7D85
MTAARPYAALRAKGEDRKQRILAAAQRLLTRNGWRSTTLAQIAAEAGVSAAGVLHHYESKEQLLHAVLDMRDAADDAHADRSGDLLRELARVPDRMRRSPELVGTYTVLLIENLDPQAPLHDRLLLRHRTAIDIVAGIIRRGQRDGHYRADVDPVIKATEITAFVSGMEMAWLLDRRLPLEDAFGTYVASLGRDLSPTAR